MDIVLTILGGILILCFLVFIHEGGHYLASRAFGVRVTEFMIGLPGPNVGFQRGRTKFGVTCIPLGGYAKVCGMEGGKMSPHIKPVLESIYTRGTATMEEVAADCSITDDEAYEALEELVDWGSVTGPVRKDKYNTYRAVCVKPTGREIERAQKKGLPAPVAYKSGEARKVEDAQALFDSEYRQQYRSLVFWKRAVILVAGIAMNLLFAMLAFILIYSIIGVDLQVSTTGETIHYNASPLQAIQIGFTYIGMVVQMVISLFNPMTAADTISNSTSVVGIVAMSGTYFSQGLADTLFFIAAISVSLGIMNLIPIPPLDGGKLLVEGIQKVSRRPVSQKVVGYVSAAGMVVFVGFFLIMLNQDIQRLISGYFG
ncbi:MAG: site-2 protease family protein [Eggerthellaceae bacterium]|nr:site-2 protease family protein [Eggerthellaceae bacterium]